MKTILITGGTSGIGKGLAMNFLKQGDRVIVVGRSVQNSPKGATFIQADLSLVSENRRVVEQIKRDYEQLDMLILCATLQAHRDSFNETPEGFEHIFALYYLSRYTLSYGLAELMEKSDSPVILNVAAPGMGGVVHWDNLQYKKNFKSMKALFNGSRLNDLLGVSFSQKYAGSKIKYILFNPMAVRTAGAAQANVNPVMKLIANVAYSIIGKSVDEAIVPMVSLLNSPPKAALSAYKEKKPVDLNMKTFDKENAEKLEKVTAELLKNFTFGGSQTSV